MARLHGSRSRIYKRQPVARDRIWTSMRVLRQFSLPDLAATADAEKDNVRKYITGLRKSGYLIITKAKREGSKHGHEVYRLVRNTGPKAPRLQSDGKTYDPNEHIVYDGGLTQCQNNKIG